MACISTGVCCSWQHFCMENMTIHSSSNPSFKPPVAHARRRLLLGSVTIAGLGMLGMAGFLPGQAAEASAQQTAAGLAAFTELSTYLTGHAKLDSVMAQTLYTALLEDNPQFAMQVASVNDFLVKTPTPATQLQAVLETAHPELATLPRRIMTGWYLGIVGTGGKARAMAYEEALMYPPVADVVVLPTYARGVPGYWAQPLKLTQS